jgi:threonine synthase
MSQVMSDRQQISYKLQCSVCNKDFEPQLLQNTASCEQCGRSPIISNYGLHNNLGKDLIDKDERSLWRYRKLLPVKKENILSLGEGWTPLLELKNIADKLDLTSLFIKDESLNPTGSFKARGMSVAISKAKELGVECCIVPTAGNAGGAMSAYCAKGKMNAIVVMPSHTPEAFKKECRAFGAELILVDGLISDCARKVAVICKERNCFEVSTMKEPYRLEGKKTMGYEIAEQLEWTLPDVILYPTGGGTGLIGMWKAFQEMAAMKWIPARFPKMIAVQVSTCSPIAHTYYGLQKNSSAYVGSRTIANGLAVPNPFAERMILDVIQNSNGTVLVVNEESIQTTVKEIAREEGLLLSPEGAALLEALKQLLQQSKISRDERVLLLNTSSVYKYLEDLQF